MSDRDDGTREQVQQRPAPEREQAGPAVETASPAVVPTTDARGAGGGMRSTLEGMDAVSRARMVTDMQRRAGNVAVQKALGQQSAAPVPHGLVQHSSGGGGRGGQSVRSPGPKGAKPGRSQSGGGAAGAQQAGEERESVNAILSSLVEHETAEATTARGRPTPVAGGGGSGAPLAPPRPPGEGGPRFRPGGLGGGDDPEDRTPLSEEELAELLERLWSLGLFRGDADGLAALLPRVADRGRGGELRAFALLAALNERIATIALELPPEGGDGAAAALWAIADAWRAALVDGRAASALDLEALVAAASRDEPERAGALRGWAALAAAEAAGFAGDAAEASALLAGAAGDAVVPPGCAVAAALRAGVLDAFVDPDRAVGHLDRAASLAEGCGRLADAGHALIRVVLVELLEGRRAAGREALHRVRRDVIGPTEAQVAAALDGVVADAPAPDVVRAVADDAAQYGDYLVAVGLVVAAARSLRRAGGDGAVDAVALLFGGISVTTRSFGPGTAGPLEFERDSIAASLGPDGFKAVMRAAIERMERGLRQRTGPAVAPL